MIQVAWTGKHGRVRRDHQSLPKFVRQAQSLWPDRTLSQQMKKIAIREAKRTNVAYRPYAIDASETSRSLEKNLDLTREVMPYLADLMDELTDQDAMDVDDTSGKGLENR